MLGVTLREPRTVMVRGAGREAIRVILSDDRASEGDLREGSRGIAGHPTIMRVICKYKVSLAAPPPAFSPMQRCAGGTAGVVFVLSQNANRSVGLFELASAGGMTDASRAFDHRFRAIARNLSASPLCRTLSPSIIEIGPL